MGILAESPTFSSLAKSGRFAEHTVWSMHLFLKSRKGKGMGRYSNEDLHFLRQRWESEYRPPLSDFEKNLIAHLSCLDTESLPATMWRHNIDNHTSKVSDLLALETDEDETDDIIDCYIWMVVGTVGSPRVQREAAQLCQTLKDQTLKKYPQTREWSALETILRKVYWDMRLAVDWYKNWCG